MKRAEKMTHFRRSIEDHIEYYRHKSPEEKLRETLELSELARRLAAVGKKADFSGKKSLKNILINTSKILSRLKKIRAINSCGLVGRIAIGALGVPSATEDIDFLVSTGNVEKFYKKLSKVIKESGFSTELKKPEHGIFPYYAVICYREEDDEKIRLLDIFVTTKNWQDEIAKDTMSVEIEGVKVPVINAEGLIILMLKSDVPVHRIDVQNILNVVNLNKLDKNKLKDWAKRAEVDKQLNKVIKNSNSGGNSVPKNSGRGSAA